MRSWVPSLVLLMVATVILVVIGLTGTAIGQTDPPALGDGDWTVSDTTVIRDWDVIMLRGDLHVTGGGSLSFINSTLLFVNQEAGEHGVLVDNGGTLRILGGATVGSSRPNVALTFVVETGCTLEIRDSNIEEVGMPAFGTRPDWKQISMYIATSDAIIENTTFTGGLAGPFFEEGVLPPPVRNCTFENFYGIISYGIGIEDCTFRNQNLFGVVFHGGDTGYVARCIFDSVFATCVQVGYEYFEPYELHPAEANVYDCTFYQSTRAIRVLDQSTSVIRNCDVDEMEREGIVTGVESNVHLVDCTINNTYDAIISQYEGRFDWTVRTSASVSGGSVTLAGDINVLEGARLDLMDIRHLTMLSTTVRPLWINLSRDATMRISGGSIEIPQQSAIPETWTPVRLGPDPKHIEGTLILSEVYALDVRDGYHLDTLHAFNCTFPVGEIWVEELWLDNCTIVPDTMASKVQLTIGGAFHRTECWFKDCVLEGLERIPAERPWLVVLRASVGSYNFLYDLKGMVDAGAIVVQGGGPETSYITLRWTIVTRVLWQNQAPIHNIRVRYTTGHGGRLTGTDQTGTTPVYQTQTESFSTVRGYSSYLPINVSVNISGLVEYKLVETVDGPIQVELVVFDLMPPRLELDQGPEIATNSTNLTLTGRVVDEHSGVSFLEMAILPAEYVRVQVDPGTGRFEHSIVLGKGYQTISVRGYDSVGNRKARLVEVYYSIIPPYVFIDDPLDGTWVNSNLTFVSGVTEAGATVELQGRITEASNGSFRIPANLVEGPNMLTVNVTSIAGNHNSTAVLVYLDTQAPSLEVVFPPSSPYHTREASHPVRGMAEPGVAVFINQVPVDSDPTGVFVTPQVKLDEGSTLVTLKAVDAAGNENVTQVVFVLDSVPPALVVLVDGMDATKYTGDEPLRTSRQTVTLTVITDEDAILFLDGEEVDMDGTELTLEHPLEEGIQSISLRVEDQAGNWQDHPPIRIDVDRTPPSLSLDPGTPNTTEEALLTLRGFTEPNCTLVVNGGRLGVDAEGRFQRVFLLNEGDNTLVIVSTDRYGQSTRLVYQVSMVAPEPEPWPDAPSLLPILLTLTVFILVVEVVVLHLYWRRRRKTGGADPDSA